MCPVTVLRGPVPPPFPLTRCCSCRPWQSFAYNPIHRQFLSIDVDGGRRLWSLKGEVLYETWKEVAQDDPDLHRYVTARVLASPRCLSLRRSCMIASYRFGGTWSPETLSVMVWSPPPPPASASRRMWCCCASCGAWSATSSYTAPKTGSKGKKEAPLSQYLAQKLGHAGNSSLSLKVFFCRGAVQAGSRHGVSSRGPGRRIGGTLPLARPARHPQGQTDTPIIHAARLN